MYDNESSLLRTLSYGTVNTMLIVPVSCAASLPTNQRTETKETLSTEIYTLKTSFDTSMPNYIQKCREKHLYVQFQ